MSTRDFTANVISATPVVPDGNFKDSKASGVWDINEALDLIKGGNWPNAANISPSAFVDGLFSCDLYKGTNAQQTITNGIDLSNNGGMIWFKNRTLAEDPMIVDTVRGGSADLYPNEANAVDTDGSISSFNSNGFTFINTSGARQNVSGYDYVSWTFRKQPKFFDVVTYTGNATARTISHNLGSVPGMILIKDLSGTANWRVFHRSVGNTKYLELNTTDAEADDANIWNDTDPTSSVFTIGSDGSLNESGRNFVAYLFAHNNNDGGFGEPGDQDIIKCGSYTGHDSNDVDVNLGFEPQWLLVKRSNGTGSPNWWLADIMRGWDSAGIKRLEAHDNAVEQNYYGSITPTSTGFHIPQGNVMNDSSSSTYIYMAIRRGGMQTPTTASSVFTVDDGQAANTSSVPGFTANHVVDFGISTTTSSASNVTGTRLLGDTFLSTDATDAETSNSVTRTSGYQNGFFFTNGGADSTRTAWMWARARGYFDVVAYSGTGSARTQSHNLGAVPEMMWVRPRNLAENWAVYHKDVGATKYLQLNTTNAEATSSTRWNDTTPTSSVFSLGADNEVNASGGYNYIAYLFATVAGVSKVGSYDGDGNSGRVIDCGFTNGASFVLARSYTHSDNWFLFDSARGIVAGNDPYYRLNTTDAEVTNADLIDVDSSGFIVNNTNGDLNDTGRSYIFYAIAAIS